MTYGIRACGYCGKEYEARMKSQKWCSSHCKALARQAAINPKHKSREQRQKEREASRAICAHCGGEYKLRNEEHKYCSPQCRGKSNIKRTKQTCLYCGKEYTPKAVDRNKYCSRECAFKSFKGRAWSVAQRQAAEARRPSLEEKRERTRLIRRIKFILNNLRECKYCGKKNFRKRYCGDKCRRAYIHALHPKKRVTQRREVVCADCGKAFNTCNPRRRYCSENCRKHAENYRHEVRRRHTLTQNGKVDYSITLGKLIKRDRGICHICGMKVDQRAEPNSDKHPSIDHVNPVALGGTHTWDNVALAHRDCNNRKSCSDVYEGANGQLRLAI